MSIPQIYLCTKKHINTWSFICTFGIFLKILMLLALILYDVINQQKVGINDRIQIFSVLGPLVFAIAVQTDLAINYQRIPALFNAVANFIATTG